MGASLHALTLTLALLPAPPPKSGVVPLQAAARLICRLAHRVGASGALRIRVATPIEGVPPRDRGLITGYYGKYHSVRYITIIGVITHGRTLGSSIVIWLKDRCRALRVHAPVRLRALPPPSALKGTFVKAPPPLSRPP